MSGFRRVGPRRQRRGHAAIEAALMAPWIFLLFLGVFDFGFYSYAMISVANAARIGALYTSGDQLLAGDSAKACAFAVEELRMLPNVGSVTCTCSGSTCTAGPISVQARHLNGAGGVPFGADGAPATEVAVTYASPQFFPIPGFMGQMTVTRVVQMRVI